MNYDLHCPYCNKGLTVCHDDGFGYAEDCRHEMQCGFCEKNFVFTTYIHFSYTAEEADCLNGSEHKLMFRLSYPKEYSRMACKDCEFTRKATEDEIKAYFDGEEKS